MLYKDGSEVFFALKSSKIVSYPYFWCLNKESEFCAIFVAKVLKSKASSIYIRSGKTLTNIPQVFFSLKLERFKTGVPIQKSFKLDTLPK